MTGKMILVVPDEVEWTNTLHSNFTTAVRIANVPRAYGFLRMQKSRWNFFVIEGEELLYYPNTHLRDRELINYLNTEVDKPIIVLMDKTGYTEFALRIEAYLKIQIAMPHCHSKKLRS